MRRTFLMLLCIAVVPRAFGLSTPEIYRRSVLSVVVVTATNSSSKAGAQGSGVVIASERVVTNCHVSDKGAEVRVWVKDAPYDATVIARKQAADLCVLQVEGLPSPPVLLRLSQDLVPGEPAFAIGAPREIPEAISNGIVSQIEVEQGVTYILTTAPISPGSSGGALLDESSFLIGITKATIRDGQNLNIAVAVDWLAELVQAEDRRRRDELAQAERDIRAREARLREKERQLEEQQREAVLAKRTKDEERQRLEAELKAEREEAAKLRSQIASASAAQRQPDEEERAIREARERQEAILEERADDRTISKIRGEERARQRALTDSVARADPIERYIVQITHKIKSRLILPEGIKGNPEVIYRVTLLPGGNVFDVMLIKSSGITAYDVAIASSIRSSEPLPVPDEPWLFQQVRQADYRFRPREEPEEVAMERRPESLVERRAIVPQQLKVQPEVRPQPKAEPKYEARAEPRPPKQVGVDENAVLRRLADEKSRILEQSGLRRRLPRLARQSGWQGTAEVRVLIGADARVKDLTIGRSSGYVASRSASDANGRTAALTKCAVKTEI